MFILKQIFHVFVVAKPLVLNYEAIQTRNNTFTISGYFTNMAGLL
jgi:hypothetical protein